MNERVLERERNRTAESLMIEALCRQPYDKDCQQIVDAYHRRIVAERREGS